MRVIIKVTQQALLLLFPLAPRFLSKHLSDEQAYRLMCSLASQRPSKWRVTEGKPEFLGGIDAVVRKVSLFYCGEVILVRMLRDERTWHAKELFADILLKSITNRGLFDTRHLREAYPVLNATIVNWRNCRSEALSYNSMLGLELFKFGNENALREELIRALRGTTSLSKLSLPTPDKFYCHQGSCCLGSLLASRA